MATYTVNSPHNGPLSSLVAGNNSIGTVFTAGPTPSRILYIKGPTGVVTAYYWHKSTAIFSLMHEQLHLLGPIDVLLDLGTAQLASTYLDTLATTYKGLCLVAQGSTYRFYPVGTPEAYLESLSYLDNPLYCSLSFTDTSPDRFVSELGNDMVYTGVTPDGRGMAYPYEYTSGKFNGSATVSSDASNLTGIDLSETFAFGCIARRVGAGLEIASYGTSPLWKLHVNPSHFLSVRINNTTEFTTSFKWNINEQHHVVMVINNTSLSVYVDGNPTSVANTTIPAVTGTGGLVIGATWQGEIQHVYRVNVLSAQQVKMLDWYFMQHASMLGGLSSTDSTDGILLYKPAELPAKLEPSAIYYLVVDDNNTRQVKQYITDGIARQVLPVT